MKDGSDKNNNVDSDIKILERMLDGLGVENAHAAAIRLSERFGSFDGVFGATEAELEEMGLSSRAASFFNFVNPALRRITAVEGGSESIVDEKTAVRNALALFGRQNKLGTYAVYLDGVGRKIFSEHLGADGPLSAAAVGACRFKTRKLLLVSVRADGEATEIESSRAVELADTIRLLDILEIGFVDYIETDGVEFFSLRRALACGGETASVFDASETPFGELDFKAGIEKYVADRRSEKRQRA